MRTARKRTSSVPWKSCSNRDSKSPGSDGILSPEGPSPAGAWSAPPADPAPRSPPRLEADLAAEGADKPRQSFFSKCHNDRTFHSEAFASTVSPDPDFATEQGFIRHRTDF